MQIKGEVHGNLAQGASEKLFQHWTDRNYRKKLIKSKDKFCGNLKYTSWEHFTAIVSLKFQHRTTEVEFQNRIIILEGLSLLDL
jgi:hypothetical protein